jgi:tRNA threonylcarbamoyladenosine dehydratase
MNDTAWLGRTELLIGRSKLEKLMNAHVLIVGMGGVGSFAAEFVCRAGVGQMTIIDGDVVDPTNRNRQLPALATTHGQSKAELMGVRLLDINPELKLTVMREFVMPDKVHGLLDGAPDYVIDAIDSLTPKITFMRAAYERGLKIVSSMGAGARLDPTRVEIADLSKTYNCPFAQQVRKQLKPYGLRSGITAVFSPEPIIKESLMMTEGTMFKRSAYGTVSYLPATFGAAAASVAIRGIADL